MQEHFKDVRKMQEVLVEAQTGLWAIELDEGKPPRMYADHAMLGLLGLSAEPTPEDCYQHWYQRIEDSYYPIVQTAVERIILNNRAEVEYPWMHPEWGKIYVRCGGVRDQSYQGGICLRGYHQNITDTVILKQEYDSVVESLSASYRSIFLCNLADKTYKAIKLIEEFRPLVETYSNIEELLSGYVELDVAPQYRQIVMDLVENGGAARRLAQGERQVEVYYRNTQNSWRNVRVVPSDQYSPERPIVVVAFSEQDQEVERRIGDATARVALSQIYTLVVTLDPIQMEYTRIHYAGDLLKLEGHGPLADLLEQLSGKMPAEDRRVLEEIFDPNQYEECRYRDGGLRLAGTDGVLHYYRYYSALVRQELGSHILLTVRNIDDSQSAQQREDILSNLCRCYYSIYLFDLENNIEEALWQEEAIHRNREFPKGGLDVYYEKFVQNYVYEADQSKMRRAGSPEFLQQTLSESQPVYEIDFRRVYPDRLAWVRSRFSMAEMRNGLVTKVIFANMDITEQKLEELEEEKRKQLYFEYQNIVQGLSSFYHSVFYVDLNARTFQTFKADGDLVKRLGESNDYGLLIQVCGKNIVGRKGLELFKRELGIPEIRRRIGSGETVYALEYQRDYGGYCGWMRVHVILAESQDGVPANVILAAHSVDAEKEQEEQNRQALLAAYETAKAANEAKSSFLAQMSHDIRTPINAIVGMTAIAASRAEDPQAVSGCLKKIELSSKHLLTLINEVLDLSRIEKGGVELAEDAFSLTELIRDVDAIIRPESAQKRQALIFQTMELIHDRLIGDPQRLRQVLLNLLTNAVKYTPEGGKITLSAQEVSQRVAGFGSFAFVVEDTGIGMAKDFLNYVFVPFSRAGDAQVRSVQGSGLGMSIAHKLVSAMGGNIQVESELGQGSRFTVTLNLQIDQDVQPERPPERDPSGGLPETDADFPVGKRLLLAEDNDLNMEIAQTLLESLGFTIRGVKDGKAALEAFTASKPGDYHAILMDLQMPVMDGYAATREIRLSGHPQAATIPIIALTANAFAEDVAKALSAGMNDHVSKPIDYAKLVGVIRKCMER